MERILRVLWASMFDPPTWWAVLSMANSLLSIARVAITGHATIGSPAVSIVASSVWFGLMLWFWTHPIPYRHYFEEQE